MTRKVLFIQGGGRGAYEADRKLAASLQESLGLAYEVVYPKMPGEDAPDYAAWRNEIVNALAAGQGEAVVVGHSLGGSLLLKYLAEEQPAAPIAGAFVIAAPFWGEEDWEVEAFALPDDFAGKLAAIRHMFFYHSRDDVWVPFFHMAAYGEALPHAVLREYDGRGHQFDDDLSDVAADILSS